MEYLFSELRMRNVSDIQTIKLALWEANGVVSIFRYPEYEAVSRLDLKVALKNVSIYPISALKLSL
ncbi:YetF domain-containing protein [Bacillus sp. HC-TM]